MPPVRFAVIGIDHVHVFGMVVALREAGAEFAAFDALDSPLTGGFEKVFPHVERVPDRRAILEDPRIELVVCAAVPNRRAGLAAEAMRHGKDVWVDKPAALTREDLAALRQAQSEGDRRFCVYFSERVASRASERALALVRAGAIGRPLQMTVFGPHQLGLVPRPDWFWDPDRAGGILVDLASHAIDQFLCLFGPDDVTIAAAQTANRGHPERSGFEDIGEILLQTPAASGYVRVDWYTPAGLGTWGDGRLFVLGTEGSLEARKYCDPAGRSGADHLLLVDGRETRHFDCSADPLPFAAQLVRDLRERSETAMSASHALRVSELAIVAQERAKQPIRSAAQESSGSLVRRRVELESSGFRQSDDEQGRRRHRRENQRQHRGSHRSE